LYYDSKVLILDEATSALDNLTQKLIINNLKSIKTGITIIMITHRLSTVRECDSIILLNKGGIKGQGTFEELVDSNDNFKAQSSEL
tara:strand:+ start:1182 stop:1439 length:258 start_codon:yes stop_codon:yes gene_type:complete